jgi:hypothetical protein
VTGATKISGGEWIEWSTNASVGWDGFGFAVDTEPVYFDVYADAEKRPGLVQFPEYPSGTPTSPAASPFGMSSEGTGSSDAGGSGPPLDGSSKAD